MKKDYFTYNNGKIYYEDSANIGEVIVFVHGFSLDHRMWEEQVKAFTDFRVITYDMRGFGKSSLPSEESEYSHHHDLLALVKYLKINKFHLVGLSLGGEVAIDFVLNNSNMVKSLTLASSSLSGYKSTVNWDVGAKEFGIEKAKENWLNHEVFGSINKNSEISRDLKEIVDDYSGWHWIYKDSRKRENAIKRLREVEIPVLLIGGEKDLAYFIDIAELIYRKVNGSKKVVVKNTGHMVNMENEGTFNEKISDFIRIHS